MLVILVQCHCLTEMSHESQLARYSAHRLMPAAYVIFYPRMTLAGNAIKAGIVFHHCRKATLLCYDLRRTVLHADRPIEHFWEFLQTLYYNRLAPKELQVEEVKSSSPHLPAYCSWDGKIGAPFFSWQVGSDVTSKGAA